MTREEQLAAVQQYLTFWEISGDPGISPWPDDPDGGELRLIGALHAVLRLVESDEVTRIVAEHLEPGVVDRS